MSYYSRYDKGDYKAVCDICGRDFKASTLKKRWDGLMCCPQDWEPRQPQDFVRGVPDLQVVPWVRDEPADNFIPFYYSSSPLDNLTVTESNYFRFTKNINFWTPTGGSLNLNAIDVLPIDGSFPASKLTAEDVNLSELFIASVGLVKQFTDFFTITESLNLIIPSTTVLDGRSINSGALNG